jgi:hypothetical protein
MQSSIGFQPVFQAAFRPMALTTFTPRLTCPPGRAGAQPYQVCNRLSDVWQMLSLTNARARTNFPAK